jgi:hypothetical protein
MSDNYEQPVEPMSRAEEILRGDETVHTMSRVEALLKELIEAGGGGGGSVVVVTPIQQSGTKIANITVNGTGYDIFAPESSGGEKFSSNEIKIGTWIDGRDIYRQLITLPYTWEITTGVKYDINSLSSSYYKVIVGHRGYTADWDDISNMFIVERSASNYIRLLASMSINKAKNLTYLLLDYVKDDIVP